MVDASVAGQKWTHENSRMPVTDKEMVDAAQNLQGWTKSVYKFGCAFIHLSYLHDYNDRDPLVLISIQERSDLLEHCRYYHGGPALHSENFSDLVPYLPRVLEKIANNLGGYLGALERNEVFNADDF